MLRLGISLFLIQVGFHAYTASLPLALHGAGVSDPQIGLVVGAAALVQIPAAFAGGALVDRFGGLRLLWAGAAAYVVASGLVLVPGVEPGLVLLPFVLVRALQGIGIALSQPAALWMVPRLVARERLGFGLSFVGAASNLALILPPAIGLAILQASSLRGVALAAIASVVAGALVAVSLPRQAVTDGQDASAEAAAYEAAGREEPRGVAAAQQTPPRPARLRVAIRRSWTPVLLITLLYVAHWGAVTAYLPQRAEAAGVSIGLFFAVDGLAIFLSRIPSGWLADRVSSRLLLVVGLAMQAFGLVLLILPPTTPLLLASGILGGISGGLVLTPLLLELTHRSDDTDRGSAFALFSAALATALALGAIGLAPVVAIAGFEAAMILGILAIVGAIFVTIVFGGTRPQEQAGMPRDKPGPEVTSA